MNYRNEDIKAQNEAKIIMEIYDSSDRALSFEKLLKVTKLSRSVLSNHLNRLTDETRLHDGTIIHPYLIRSYRKYKLTDTLKEEIDQEGGFIYLTNIRFVKKRGRPRQ